MKGIQQIKNGVSNENIEYIDTKNKETIEAWKGMWENALQASKNKDKYIKKLEKENGELRMQIYKLKNER